MWIGMLCAVGCQVQVGFEVGQRALILTRRNNRSLPPDPHRAELSSGLARKPEWPHSVEAVFASSKLSAY